MAEVIERYCFSSAIDDMPPPFSFNKKRGTREGEPILGAVYELT
jgi:hypothetical protein